MTILDKIVAHKRHEVEERMKVFSVMDFQQIPLYHRPTLSLAERLRNPDSIGIIAEFKRHSPSKGDINPKATVKEVTTGYAANGAVGLSVLTDEKFFKGTGQDIMLARGYNKQTPILRKDFIVDAYQIYEARAMGADVILLIAECLTAEEVQLFAKCAKSLQLEVLIEVHSADQLEKLVPEIDIVGVNNRNLKTFEVDTQTSIDLYHKIPDEFVKISESGISDPNEIYHLRRQGFQGFLIGEYFMKAEHPPQKLAEFLERVNYLEDLLNNAIA